MEPLSALAYVLRGAEKCKSLKSRPCENSPADFCTSETESSKNQPPLPLKKVDGLAFRSAKIYKRNFTWS